MNARTALVARQLDPVWQQHPVPVPARRLVSDRRGEVHHPGNLGRAEDSLECPGAKLAPRKVCIALIVDTNLITGDRIEFWHIEGDVPRIVERHRKVKAGAGRVVSDSR